MHQSLAKFSESEASNHTPSLADFTTTTPELKFSVHTRGEGAYGRDRNARRYETPCIAQLFSGRNVSTSNSRGLFRYTFEFARRPSAYCFYFG